MVRFILKLLVVIFLMQSAWAAAAVYCRHELGLESTHFGHHSHAHKNGNSDQAAPSDQPDDTSTSGIDNDCPYCHLGAMKAMRSIIVIVPALAEPPPAIAVAISYPAVFPRQPERPNWRTAA